MTNDSMFLSLEEFKLRQKLHEDLEANLPSIWEIIWGKDAKKHYEEYLDELRNESNKDQMAEVMKQAVIESCNLYITQAQESFDKL